MTQFRKRTQGGNKLNPRRRRQLRRRIQKEQEEFYQARPHCGTCHRNHLPDQPHSAFVDEHCFHCPTNDPDAWNWPEPIPFHHCIYCHYDHEGDTYWDCKYSPPITEETCFKCAGWSSFKTDLPIFLKAIEPFSQGLGYLNKSYRRLADYHAQLSPFTQLILKLTLNRLLNPSR